jgi:uncharacterized protein involved in tolerance to divalent cations
MESLTMNYKTTITFTPEQLAMIKDGLQSITLWYDSETGKLEEHRISKNTVETMKALAQHIKDMHSVTLNGSGS